MGKDADRIATHPIVNIAMGQRRNFIGHNSITRAREASDQAAENRRLNMWPY